MNTIKWFKKRLFSCERGSAVMFAASMITFAGFSGLVVDAGLLYVARAQLVTAVDAGVLAAAQDLPDETAARARCAEYINANLMDSILFGAVNIAIDFPEPLEIRAQATMPVSTVFLRVLGLNSSDVAARSQALRIDPDLELIVDRSGSMCEDSHGIRLNCPNGPTLQPMQDVKDAAVLFTTEVSDAVYMGLISYSTSASTDQILTDNHTAIQQAVQDIHPTGYTNIGGAINEATQDLVLNGREDHPRIIVLITDGRPNVVNNANVGYGEPARQHARDAAVNARAAEAAIFSVAFGDTADQTLLQELAAMTSGVYYNAPTAADLLVVFQDIADRRLVRLVSVTAGPISAP